ncbi:MAG TPA: hypothetical protein VOA87_03955 [Thermoanaerobaculia bacterium]|nr:hypothetical protein [Thermoanaerobaculia bacterium]
MATSRSFKAKLTEWQALFNNAALHLADIPQLATDHAALGTLLAEASTLQGDQDLAKAQLKKRNLQRTAIQKDADVLRNRLAATAKGAVGLTSADLLQFGVKPRPVVIGRPRRSKAEVAETLARKAARAQAQAAAAEAVKAANRAKAEAAVKLVP